MVVVSLYYNLKYRRRSTQYSLLIVVAVVAPTEVVPTVVVSLYYYLKYSRRSTYYSSTVVVAVVAPTEVVLMVIVFCTTI